MRKWESFVILIPTDTISYICLLYTSIASFYCVTAMTDKSAGVKGMSMFFVEAGTPGLSTGHEEDKMGIRTSNTCDCLLYTSRCV